MRKYNHRHIAGACGCCLVPLIILLIIFVAGIVFTSMVWHAALPGRFEWEPMQHHHFDAYRAGFQQGSTMGEQYAARGQVEPSASDVNDLARREAERLHVTRDRGEWMKGFRDGFERGYAKVSKEARLDVTFSKSIGAS